MTSARRSRRKWRCAGSRWTACCCAARSHVVSAPPRCLSSRRASPRGVTNIRTGNPDLKAERSRNFNVGAVWSPDGDTSIGLDWYRIEQDNLVKPDSAQFIVDNPTLFPGRVQRDAQGRIQFITNQYANQGELTTSGLDLDATRTFRTDGWGSFTVAGSWSHLLSFKQPLVAGQAPT
ncbi:hypothetical protein G6F63_013663 [Rhizopus arrhizus]|nr:hypothetical protein G6F63_013663 [Rhizopus arrhizus]